MVELFNFVIIPSPALPEGKGDEKEVVYVDSLWK
jgi:hypothetical protein